MAETENSTVPPSLPEFPLTAIESHFRWQLVDWRELWQYRELLYRFSLRDVMVRYKQALIGVAWAVFQPLVMMLIFSVLFNLLGHETAAGNRALIVLCAILPWQLFANTITQSCGCLVSNQHLITKAYFPRIILPMSTLASGLLDFGVGLVILAALLLAYGVVPTWAVLALPFFLLLTVLASLAVGLWVAALNALYRDVGYVLPFFVQIGFFVTPVIYTTAELNLSQRSTRFYELNPLVGIIEGFRWSLLGTNAPSGGMLFVSVAVVVLLLIGGLLNFHAMERVFADRI